MTRSLIFRLTSIIVLTLFPIMLGVNIYLYYIYSVPTDSSSLTDYTNSYFGLKSLYLLADDYVSDVSLFSENILKLIGYLESKFDNIEYLFSIGRDTTLTEYADQPFKYIFDLIGNILMVPLTIIAIPFATFFFCLSPLFDLVACIFKALNGTYNIPLPNSPLLPYITHLHTLPNLVIV